jgi:hypothetical protein
MLKGTEIKRKDNKSNWSTFNSRYSDLRFNCVKQCIIQFKIQLLKNTFDWFRCKFDFVQLWRVFFTYCKFKIPNPRNMSMRFLRGLVISWTGDLFFPFINLGKNIIFTSLPFKDYWPISLQIQFWYNFGRSSLHIVSFKALTQVSCPESFRVAWSIFWPAICFFL